MRLAGRILVESRGNIGLGTTIATRLKHRPHEARDPTARPIGRRHTRHALASARGDMAPRS